MVNVSERLVHAIMAIVWLVALISPDHPASAGLMLLANVLNAVVKRRK